MTRRWASITTIPIPMEQKKSIRKACHITVTATVDRANLLFTTSNERIVCVYVSIMPVENSFKHPDQKKRNTHTEQLKKK